MVQCSLASLIWTLGLVNCQKACLSEHLHNNDRYADLPRVLKELLVVRDIVGRTTRRVELARAEGRGDGYYWDDRVLYGFWSTWRHGFIEPHGKAGPEEEIQFLGLVDAIRQGLEVVRAGLNTLTGGLQKTRPWLRQPDSRLRR